MFSSSSSDLEMSQLPATAASILVTLLYESGQKITIMWYLFHTAYIMHPMGETERLNIKNLNEFQFQS